MQAQEIHGPMATLLDSESARQWVERGGNLAALQQVRGQSSIETTQRYARLSDEIVMREAERVAVDRVVGATWLQEGTGWASTLD